MTVNTTHTQPVWTEIEYTALCKNPYLSTPFYVPKESKVFQCKEDGSRKEARMLYPVSYTHLTLPTTSQGSFPGYGPGRFH